MTGLGASFRSSDFSYEKRGAAWQQVLSSAYSGLSFRWKNESKASAELSHYDVSEFQLTRFCTSAAEYSRERRHIRNDDSESYGFVSVLSGMLSISDESSCCECTAGSFYIIDHSQPSTLHNDSHVTGLMIRVPKKLLMANLHDADNICGTLFNAKAGSARIALDYLDSMSQQAGRMSEQEFLFSCRQLTDLFSLSLDGMTEVQSAETTVQNILLSRIKHYVRGEITNPELSTTLIAQKFSVTPRYIQMLFSKIGITGRDYIRNSRLEYTRNLLQSPLQRSRSITEIAFGAGFSSSAHFSTAFKKRYGVPPSAARTCSPDLIKMIINPEPHHSLESKA